MTTSYADAFVESAKRALGATEVRSGFVAPVGGQEFEPLSPGAHIARLYGLIDLGKQDGIYGPKHQVLLMFEVLDAKRDDGEPYIVSKRTGFSMNEKATLRSIVGSWRGKKLSNDEAKSFDLQTLLGKQAQLQISHNDGKDGRVYANIAGVFPTNSPNLPHTKTEIAYSIANHDQDAFEALPEWVQKTINARVVD